MWQVLAKDLTLKSDNDSLRISEEKHKIRVKVKKHMDKYSIRISEEKRKGMLISQKQMDKSIKQK